MLAHPLPLLPLLALLPYNFLPAGVVFFIPIICILTVLSSCAHIVIVYLSWYLKVSSFEDVFASVTGKYGQYGQWAGRAAVITSTLGLFIGWLESEPEDAWSVY
jgi:amino acid permease